MSWAPLCLRGPLGRSDSDDLAVDRCAATPDASVGSACTSSAARSGWFGRFAAARSPDMTSNAKCPGAIKWLGAINGSVAGWAASTPRAAAPCPRIGDSIDDQ